ncbi:hypothetical protein BKA59DRAFT_473596 [Fusarium tricinctum]|uniref:Uncharacterized protein n=1 Tax=Fusarium tricinctum TaxID=61284 RepID=A0A8K0S538_9HYPO|nr:hypothetical protein BKA59DRAFT_473596 [Fusarium tricinctum]
MSVILITRDERKLLCQRGIHSGFERQYGTRQSFIRRNAIAASESRGKKRPYAELRNRTSPAISSITLGISSSNAAYETAINFSSLEPQSSGVGDISRDGVAICAVLKTRHVVLPGRRDILELVKIGPEAGDWR